NERTGQKAGEKNERTGQKAGEKNERTGEKAGEKNERMGQQPGEKNAPSTAQQPTQKNAPSTAQQPTQKNAPSTAQQPSGTTTTERSSTAKSVQLSSEQRTQVRSMVISHREARVDHVDFSVSIGTRVPRSVHVVVLPPDVVRIVPQFRGFKYFIVREEIVIIDPDTLEIVAVLPA